MKSDMTYNLIDCEKLNLSNFVNKLNELSQRENIEFEESDKSFFSMIAKQIIFLKYFVLSLEKGVEIKYIKTIISDLYFLVMSIIKREQRYIYVNLRSIIENSIRMFTDISVEENYLTQDIFDKIKSELSRDEYSLLRSEYRVACNYIHGGSLLEENLAFVLEECLKKTEMSSKEKNAFYGRICRLIKIFDKEIILHYTEYINGCFHRRKSLMEYLIGKGNVDLLFDTLKAK